MFRLAAHRQESLHLILENIHDPHNVSAIFRSCDAIGIPAVSLVYNIEKFPKIGKKSSASAFKWVEKVKYSSIESCFNKLKSEGFKIFASCMNEQSKNLFELDLTGKCAIIFGNEHRGLSEEAIEKSDVTFHIPMVGVVQSLNVSVAAAVTLYEVFRQRRLFEKVDSIQLDAFQQQLFEKYLTK